RIGTVRFRAAASAPDTLTFSPDGKTLASASAASPVVQLWEVPTGKELRRFLGHTGGVRSLAFTPNGKALTSAGLDGTVRLWDTASGRETRCLRLAEDGHAVALSPDGKLLAAGSADGLVELWDLETDRAPQTLDGHTEAVNSVAFAPDGRTL